MTLSAVTAGDQATAAQYNAIKNHLEGDASSTLAWFLRCTASQNFVVRLSDAGGVQKFSIQDSAGAEVAQIDSNGDLTLSGTFTPGVLQLPTGTAPTPTTEGEMWWDTDDDRLVIGDGASQVLIGATHTTHAGAIVGILDGAGAAIAAGTIIYIEVPFACTITQHTLLADVSGSVTVRIWKDTYANYPPLAADDISNGGTAISTATKAQDATLTSWTTSISAGDIIAMEVQNIATTITRVTSVLKVTKT